MKVALLSLSLCCVILAAGGSLLLSSQLQETASLRRFNARLQDDLRNLGRTIRHLEESGTKLSGQLREQQAEAGQIRSELAALKEIHSRATEPVSATPRPQKIQAYLGREPLGQAWLFPARARPDAPPGKETLPPAVVLDESLRKNLTVYKTNLIEREVEVLQPSTVNYNYTPPRTYYYPVYYPAWNLRQQPVRQQPASPSIPPSPVLAPRGGSPRASPWGSGVVRRSP